MDSGTTEDTFSEAYSAKVTVKYPNGKTVEFGQELKPVEVKDEPQVSWDADPKKYYTFMMIDPDAPSKINPTFAHVKHWLVVNVLGCDLATGETIAEFIESGPPKDTGLHRYIFLVFEQNGKIQFEEPKSRKDHREHRLKWSVDDFVSKYKLGKAYAGNYYQAQWDEYVDEFRKRMDKNQEN